MDELALFLCGAAGSASLRSKVLAMRARTFLVAVLIAFCVAFARSEVGTILPSGLHLTPPQTVATTGTMPQGIALSPDGAMVAILESGVGPPALRILDARNLHLHRLIRLRGAFGRPVWRDARHVLVAGANADALLTADVSSGNVAAVAIGTHAWPAAVALSPGATQVAVCNDGDGTLAIGSPGNLWRLRIGAHPADAVFSRDGSRVYVTIRSAREVAVVDTATRRVIKRIAVGLHPSALELSGDGTDLYVAESDDDTVGVISLRAGVRVAGIPVGLGLERIGASPNALAISGRDLFVSLGAQNAVAIVRNRRVVARIPAGWYPTGVAVSAGGTLYVSNGKGERAPPNPRFDPRIESSYAAGYIGLITVGSVRAVPHAATAYANAAAAGTLEPRAPQSSVVRANGRSSTSSTSSKRIVRTTRSWETSRVPTAIRASRGSGRRSLRISMPSPGASAFLTTRTRIHK